MATRPTRRGVTHSVAKCEQEDCGWQATTYRNALALGALHYDKTGHEVRIEHCLVIIYGGDAEPIGEARVQAAPVPTG